MALTLIAALSLLIWLYLATLRGGFWRADQRLPAETAARDVWPEVVALVPARDEAGVIGHSVASLLAQDYPGSFSVLVIDDHSNDGTADAAMGAARKAARAEDLRVVTAGALPPGWSGKLWALSQGLEHAAAEAPRADFVWLSDADIAHGPQNLRRLVAKALDEDRDLVSLMVALSCRGFWERFLIPPFIYFFQMLYPFAWVNDPRRRTAAAAGGCVLLRRRALEAAGGFEAIKGELIDDCALAQRIKGLGGGRGGAGGGAGDSSGGGRGRIWLGLTTTARSIRPYRGLGEIWRMVARSAYTQLGRSPLLLAGCLLGMALTFLAPPLIGLTAELHNSNVAAMIGFATWSLMALSAVPTYRLYGQPIWLAAFLPLAAALYCAMTLDSAVQHWRGRGGRWKGRMHPDAREVAENSSGE
jgi:hopene-associated glycosyltransferase HpnB